MGRVHDSCGCASFAEQAGKVNSGRAKLFPTRGEGKLSTARDKSLQRHGNWLFLDAMDADRIERAVQRIENALARISAVADSARPAPPSVAALIGKHDALRETVETALVEIDALIGRLEQ